MSDRIITVSWGDKKGTLNENEAFLAIEAVEEHVTFFELIEMQGNLRKLKTIKLAKAYAALCAVAGIKVTPQEVRKGLTESFNENGGADFFSKVSSVILPLVDMMSDGAPSPSGEAQEVGNVEDSSS